MFGMIPIIWSFDRRFVFSYTPNDAFNDGWLEFHIWQI